MQVLGGTTQWFRYGRGGGERLTMTSSGEFVRVLHGLWIASCEAFRKTSRQDVAQRHRRPPEQALQGGIDGGELAFAAGGEQPHE